MINMELEYDAKELNRQLGRLPGLMQKAAFDKGLRPAAKVIQKRVKAITPRSSRSGSKDKWSKSMRDRRQNDTPTWKTVKVKLWRAKDSGIAMAMVGYEFPDGNPAYFAVEHKRKFRKQYLWGKRSTDRKKDDVLKRAMDESRRQAGAAFVTGVASEVQSKLQELGRG